MIRDSTSKAEVRADETVRNLEPPSLVWAKSTTDSEQRRPMVDPKRHSVPYGGANCFSSFQWMAKGATSLFSGRLQIHGLLEAKLRHYAVNTTVCACHCFVAFICRCGSFKAQARWGAMLDRVTQSDHMKMLLGLQQNRRARESIRVKRYGRSSSPSPCLASGGTTLGLSHVQYGITLVNCSSKGALILPCLSDSGLFQASIKMDPAAQPGRDKRDWSEKGELRKPVSNRGFIMSIVKSPSGINLENGIQQYSGIKR
ncbi:hypothetical protein BJX99DRAFT_6032 [Aspergillus californicus]